MRATMPWLGQIDQMPLTELNAELKRLKEKRLTGDITAADADRENEIERALRKIHGTTFK